jgi:hypothetical protein
MLLGKRNTIFTLAIQLTLLGLPILARAADSQNEPDPEVLLQRIREKVAEHLLHLPSYTCLEVVDRWVRSASSQSLYPMDRVEVEVAFVGNQEYFAPRGGTEFDSSSITKTVPVGTIGNGTFGAHVKALFDTDSPTFKYVGPSNKDKHKTFRYDFMVPQERSHFLVKGSGQGIVAFKGSFWVDAETLDLVRLELNADHLPSYIGVRFFQESMQYSTVRIRDSDFLLASKSEMSAMDSRGNYSLNLIRLQNCREFRGDSIVSYHQDSPDQ